MSSYVVFVGWFLCFYHKKNQVNDIENNKHQGVCINITIEIGHHNATQKHDHSGLTGE